MGCRLLLSFLLKAFFSFHSSSFAQAPQPVGSPAEKSSAASVVTAIPLPDEHPLNPDPTPSGKSSNPLISDPEYREDPIYKNLPLIDAKTYQTRVQDKSNSNRIYLLVPETPSLPHVGRILLFKDGNQNVMAFQVLRNYPEQQMVGVRKVRLYRGILALDVQSNYLTIEKITDVKLRPPSKLEQGDLLELEKRAGIKPSAYDPDLDAGICVEENDSELDSSNKQSHDNLEINENEDELYRVLEGEESFILEKKIKFDPFDHWLSLGLGLVRNSNSPSQSLQKGSYTFAAGNLKYGVTLSRNIMAKSSSIQDNLAVEGGFWFYKTLNYYSLGDAFEVISLSLVLRYNVFFSPQLIVFGYSGVLQNLVSYSNQAKESAIQALTNLNFALGLGGMVEIGPQCFIRVDLGLDSYSGNLLIRF